MSCEYSVVVDTLTILSRKYASENIIEVSQTALVLNTFFYFLKKEKSGLGIEHLKQEVLEYLMQEVLEHLKLPITINDCLEEFTDCQSPWKIRNAYKIQSFEANTSYL